MALTSVIINEDSLSYLQCNDFICHQTCPHSVEKNFLGQKMKTIDQWSADVTLVSMAVNWVPACNYIQIA